MKTATRATATQPMTASAWRSEQTRRETELRELRGKIDTEHKRRQRFAVAAASGDPNGEANFNASFDSETGLRRDFERLEALIAHATEQAAQAEAAEHQEAERLRIVGLNANNAALLARGRRIDELFADLAGEVKGLAADSAENGRLGGRFHHRAMKDIMSSAAKAVGARNWLHLFTGQKPRLAVDQIQSFVGGAPIPVDDTEENAA